MDKGKPISDLARLLAELSPIIHEQEFVFVSVDPGKASEFEEWQAVASCREEEGLSLVVSRAIADRQNLPYEGVFRQISLRVHSSLHAVGLTAAVSGALARHGIPANMIAGHHHDHVFVPVERAEEALALLEQL